jgi:hypothetical protein
MYENLKEKTRESLQAVLPITGIVLAATILLVPMDIGTVSLFLACALMLVVGMGLFQLGAEMAMTPLGEGVGIQLSKTKKFGIVLLISLVVGVVITIAEPDLQVLAAQVPSIPNLTLILTVAVGVGIMLAVSILRMFLRIRLSTMLMVLYGAVFLVAVFAPPDFLPVAFDSGGVTTGPITVPFIIAMGVGLASVRSDKDAGDDSFGLVALGSVGPILAVLFLSIFFKPEYTAYSPVVIANIGTSVDVVKEIGIALPHYAGEVLISIVPVWVVFLVFQVATRRFHRVQFRRMIIGMLYTYLGLTLFLCGVNVGFAPVGSLLGSELASHAAKWLLIPIGMIMGFFIVKAEPAVQVLNDQVEDVTNGAIPARAMNRSLSIGVAASIGLAMLRVLTGIHIFWIIIPGYIIALALSRIVPKIFVGIAFDAGGVASGPMTATFLLPMSMGASVAAGGNVMTDAFGIVALVAMTPLIAVQIMGLIYQNKMKKLGDIADAAVGDDILDLEEASDD